MPSPPDQTAFVPGFKYDVFVSYAQVDDIPDIDSQPGWVTNLVQKLSSRLAQQLGGSETFKLWMDRKQEDGLGGNELIDEKIQDTLEGTAIMVVIMSPAYLKRRWCRLELAAFSEAIQKGQLNKGRIFIVERENVEQTERPTPLQNLRGYRFWIDQNGEGHRTLGIPVPTVEERPYWDALTRLSTELATELEGIKGAIAKPSPVVGPVAVPSDDRPVVCLAEATDDLYYVRKQVVDYLNQAGLRVVPSATVSYPVEEDKFRAAVEQDLAASSSVFVQLLSGVPSRYQRYVALQNELAAKSGKTILHWRSRDLDLSQVEDQQLRDLLNGETVLAVGIEEFKKTVVERVKAAARAPTVPPAAVFIRVSADAEDAALLEAIEGVLNQNQVYYDAGAMDNLDEEVKYVFENCDGFIIPYRKRDVKDVEKRLRGCLTQMFRQKRKPLLVVYQASKDKPTPGISMPGLRIVKAGEPVNGQELLMFISDLRKNAAQMKPAGV